MKKRHGLGIEPARAEVATTEGWESPALDDGDAPFDGVVFDPDPAGEEELVGWNSDISNVNSCRLKFNGEKEEEEFFKRENF